MDSNSKLGCGCLGVVGLLIIVAVAGHSGGAANSGTTLAANASASQRSTSQAQVSTVPAATELPTPLPPTTTPPPTTATPFPTRVPELTASDGWAYHIVAATSYQSISDGSTTKDADYGDVWLVSVVDVTNKQSRNAFRVGGNEDDYILVDGNDKYHIEPSGQDVASTEFNVEQLGGFFGTEFDSGQTKTVIFAFQVPAGNHRYEESFQKSNSLVNLAIYLHDSSLTVQNFRQTLASATAQAAHATATAGAIRASTAAAVRAAAAKATSQANAPLAVQHLGAGNTLLQAGNLPGAVNEYATAQALSPSRPDVQSAIGTAQALTAKATAAVIAKEVQDHLGAAHSFEQAGNYAAALKEYDAALAIDPSSHPAISGQASAAHAATATAQARAQATATAQQHLRAVNPPSGTYSANNGTLIAVASGFRYFNSFGYNRAGQGARYIAFGMGVGGIEEVEVSPNDFTLVLDDGTSYSYDELTFSYWSTPLKDATAPKGGHVEGGLVFLVKDGVAPREIIYQPEMLFAKEIVIDLTRPD